MNTITSRSRGFMSIILILIIVAALGGGAWYVSRGASPEQGNEITASTTVSGGTTFINQPTNNSIQPSGKTFVTFISPKAGDSIPSAPPTTIRWNPITQDVQTKFKGFSMALAIVDSNGTVMGRIGDGYALDVTSATKSFADQMFYPLVPGAQYKIRADLGYFPPSGLGSGCDPAVKTECVPQYSDAVKQLIAEAKSYVSDSAPFTFGTAKEASSATFVASPISGIVPLKVTITLKGKAAGYEKLDYGDGHTFSWRGNPVNEEVVCEEPNLDVCRAIHTYLVVGTYTAMAKDASGNVLGSATVTVK